MSRTTVLNDGVWPRAARFLVAVLLFGGMAAGPVAHLAADAALAAGTTCQSEHQPGTPDHLPDTHHDCPVCVTLATATPSGLPATPSDRLAGVHIVAASASTMGEAEAFDLSRARAPPKA